MVLTRAFACGTPVVASDISGYRGVMEPEAGLLAPPGDAAALVEAVAELLGNEARREAFGRSARAIAQERYSWERIAERLAELYESLAVSRKAAAA
jgi:phosphatidylinositol alpha-mannosyltransferase